MTNEEFKNALNNAKEESIIRNGAIQSTANYLANTASNVIPSGKQLIKDTVQIFIDPIGTAKTLKELADGIVLNMTGADGKIYDRNGNVIGEDTEGKRKQEIANAVGEYFKQRYGGVENVKESFKNDPVGVLADVSIIFTGGASIAPKGGAVASVATRGATLTDPISATIALGQGIKNVTQNVGTKFFDKTTGTGGMISTSYAVGKLDNATASNRQKKKDFKDARQGKLDAETLVNDAMSALNETNKKMKEAYAKDKKTLSLADHNISPVEVGQRLLDIIKANDDFSDLALASVEKIKKKVIAFQKDPSQWNLAGLDRLKRNISNETPTKLNQQTADQANPYKLMKGAIVDIINNKAPEYVPVMNAYQEANDLQRMLSKELSFKPNDPNYNAMLTKLSQTMKQNTNTNTFSGKADALKTLDSMTGANLTEKVAGLSANPLLPTGLTGMTGTFSSFYNPMRGLAMLGGGSPRAISNIAYGAGAVDRVLDPVLAGLRNNALGLNLARQGGVIDRVANQPQTFTDLFNQRPNQTAQLARESGRYLRGLLMGDE